MYNYCTELFFNAVQCFEMSCKIFIAWHCLYPSSWLLMYVAMLPWSSSNFLMYDLLFRCRLHTLAKTFYSLSPWPVLCAWSSCHPFLYHDETRDYPLFFFVFFSTGWQFTLKIQPHFSRNWGTWYTRATKNNKRTIMIIIILKVINIIVIQFFKIGLQDYWPTVYVGSYVLVIAHFRALSWNYWGGRYCSSLICASRAENSSEKPWNWK